jgi:hypothetical protein
VPLAAGVLNVVVSVEISPEAVPQKKNRRFGYVCASTEQK